MSTYNLNTPASASPDLAAAFVELNRILNTLAARLDQVEALQKTILTRLANAGIP